VVIPSRKRRLWIRADGGPKMGLGHLMRTVAIAEEALARRLEVHFVVADDPSSAHRLISRLGLTVCVLTEPWDWSWAASVEAGDFIVVDGQHFAARDVEAALATGAMVAVVDDSGAEHPGAHLVLSPDVVSIDTHRPRHLAGPRYALVRSEFRKLRRVRVGGPGRIAVAMGGSDSATATNEVVNALLDQRTFRSIVVLCGPGGPPLLAGAGWVGVEIVRDPPSVAEVFDRADACISAAGTTAWELCSMGVPAAFVSVADGQDKVGRLIEAANAGMALGTVPDAIDRLGDTVRLLSDPAWQRTVSLAALSLIDGQGPSRFVSALLDLTDRG
jgi:UDP-2,4-diacetamido-2,4,6-trideoxy-beta-L-altropyranose hydrolase